MQIIYGGLLLDGTDSPEVKYTIERDGVSLFGGAGVRRDLVERSNAHGAFTMPGFLEAKPIQIRGDIHSRSLAEQERDMAALSAVLAEGGQIELVVNSTSHETLRASVEQMSGPQMKIEVPGKFARYQLSLRAPDPWWRAAPRTFVGSSVEAFQYGTFPAVPVVSVVGPRTGPYTITGPSGRQITIAQSLAAGQTHRIDFETGRVYRNGALQLGAVSKFQPWTVPPSGRALMSISAGSMTVTVSDTYNM